MGLENMVGHWMELLYNSEFQFSKYLIIFKQMRHSIKYEIKSYTQPQQKNV
jgi:hypothetical protein